MCRLTQVTANLAATRWAAVKVAAAAVKADDLVSGGIKSKLKVDAIALGEAVPNLTNTLRAKLTAAGCTAILLNFAAFSCEQNCCEQKIVHKKTVHNYAITA